MLKSGIKHTKFANISKKNILKSFSTYETEHKVNNILNILNLYIVQILNNRRKWTNRPIISTKNDRKIRRR
jgi:hypothetical protein